MQQLQESCIESKWAHIAQSALRTFLAPKCGSFFQCFEMIYIFSAVFSYLHIDQLGRCIVATACYLVQRDPPDLVCITNRKCRTRCDGLHIVLLNVIQDVVLSISYCKRCLYSILKSLYPVFPVIYGHVVNTTLTRVLLHAGMNRFNFFSIFDTLQLSELWLWAETWY